MFVLSSRNVTCEMNLSLLLCCITRTFFMGSVTTSSCDQSTPHWYIWHHVSVTFHEGYVLPRRFLLFSDLTNYDSFVNKSETDLMRYQSPWKRSGTSLGHFHVLDYGSSQQLVVILVLSTHFQNFSLIAPLPTRIWIKIEPSFTRHVRIT